MAESLVDIYDRQGQILDHLRIDEPLHYIDGRITIGIKSGLYYKGAGIPYTTHFVLEPTHEYTSIRYTDVDYLGYEVIKKSFVDLSGIFEEKYQPQFSDFIGTCGNKELSILENVDDFKLSSLQLRKVVNWDKTNSQYYFVVDYLCGRKKYLDYGNPVDLKNLLSYMIQNNWNFIWDKRSISDVSYNGLVTDVADIFKSASLNHKIGTVYSILYSLSKIDSAKYYDLLSVLKYKHTTDMDYIFNSVRFIRDSGIDISELYVDGGDVRLYNHILKNYLITGKNCAHCSYAELGEKVMNDYKNRLNGIN
jgi:hypothetical protein